MRLVAWYYHVFTMFPLRDREGGERRDPQPPALLVLLVVAHAWELWFDSFIP